jgi:hypothetical protein
MDYIVQNNLKEEEIEELKPSRKEESLESLPVSNSLKRKQKEKILIKRKDAFDEFDTIFIKNKLFVKDALSQDPFYFKKRLHTQNPKFLFIGCSDSRLIYF